MIQLDEDTFINEQHISSIRFSKTENKRIWITVVLTGGDTVCRCLKEKDAKSIKTKIINQN